MYSITIEYEKAIAFTKQALEQQMELRPSVSGIRKPTSAEWTSKPTATGCRPIWIYRWHLLFEVALGSSGRVYNTITSVAQGIATVLAHQRHTLGEIDVSNCSPCSLQSSWKNGQGKHQLSGAADIVHYRELCEAGGFYRYLIYA
jgi:hypothetical protein